MSDTLFDIVYWHAMNDLKELLTGRVQIVVLQPYEYTEETLRAARRGIVLN